MGLIEASGLFGNYHQYARIRGRRDSIKQLWRNSFEMLSSSGGLFLFVDV